MLVLHMVTSHFDNLLVAQLAGKDKEHQDETEALKNKHQEEIFELKQQNHYLSAKVGPSMYKEISSPYTWTVILL